MAYLIKENPKDAKEGFQPYGAAAEYWRCKDHEVMLSGPAETGKTRCGLEKLDALMWKYAGAQAVIVRKVAGTLNGTALGTWRKVVSPAVKPFGGERPVWYDYPNKSRVWLAGMDDPGKALSSERDFIYVNQAEELKLEDWETLLTRCTGRAGNTPYPQMGGDCNPGGRSHWILSRKNKGQMKFFESRHQDNPTLYDVAKGDWTEQGIRTLRILDSLTGVRLQRLRYGKWVSAEGAVYPTYDSAVHLIKRFPINPTWRRIRVIDFGYTNPFVCQWWAQDEDGRIYRYRELYGTKKIVSEWAKLIKQLSVGENIEATVADHDAEDRATLAAEGIGTVAAHKEIKPGIERVQKRLELRADGKPGLFLLEGVLTMDRDQELEESHKPCCTEEEVDGYVWSPPQDGKDTKELPVKENDHGLDAARYAVWYFDQDNKWLTPSRISGASGMVSGYNSLRGV